MLAKSILVPKTCQRETLWAPSTLKSNRLSQSALADAVDGVLTMGCPSCGRQIPIGDTRADGFPCPWCKADLKRTFRGGRVANTAILLLSFYLCYAAGVRGVNVIFPGLIVYLFIGCVWHFITIIHWPKFERDPLAGDKFLHIVPPPDRSEKP